MTPSPQSECCSGIPNICVCVCTYKRPHYLRRLLSELGRQETGGLFTFSVVVADNDCHESAQSVVAELATGSPIPVTYCVEPRQNISLARNKALENSTGQFLAFIDDDEFPKRDWLLQLFTTCAEYDVDGSLGPVKRHFDDPPPDWVLKGKFYDRPTYPTGLVINWSMGRTNNALVKRSAIPADALPFRPDFRTGEDQDFFRRAMESGKRFVWCNEAIAYEVVPPIRWKRSFMLRRALLQGTVAQLLPTEQAHSVARSLVAIPLYVAALPFSLLFGQHRFVALCVKIAYHAGRLLAFLHLNPIRDPYVVG